MGRDALTEDLVQGEDGFWVFWPTENKGAYTADHLIQIAEAINEKNWPWEDFIRRNFPVDTT